MNTHKQLLPLVALMVAGWAAPASSDVQIELDPAFQALQPGETATLQGRVMDLDGEPLSGEIVDVLVIQGPHAGIDELLTTDSEGGFTFAYVGNSPGLDLIRAEVQQFGPPPRSVEQAQAFALQPEPVVATAQVEWLEETLPAPDCNTVVASPFLIWPPNHKMRAVTLHGPDPVDGVEAEVTALYVHQDEPTNWRGDGNFAPDAEIGEDGQTVSVRAERSGLLDGRLYFVGFEASLPGGGECQGEALLGVPHDRGQGHLPQDSGERYDSVTGEHLTAED